MVKKNDSEEADGESKPEKKPPVNKAVLPRTNSMAEDAAILRTIESAKTLESAQSEDAMFAGLAPVVDDDAMP